ncbi:MAG: hypothetical protein KDJ36_08910 [Hyphomicrobiaceae bacterium]|nr:hypothetical protein [Hyphomicrobiaceae bacterium]
MKDALNWIAGVATALAIAFASIAVAQAQSEEGSFEQIKLTEAQVKGYLAASKKLAAVSEKIEAAGDKPDPKLLAQLETIAKANGFKNYDELDNVISNISFVLSGFDDKGNFTDPHAALKSELEQVKADKSVKGEEKKKMIAEIEQSLKTTPELKFKENIEVVKKYLKDLDDVLQKQ